MAVGSWSADLLVTLCYVLTMKRIICSGPQHSRSAILNELVVSTTSLPHQYDFHKRILVLAPYYLIDCFTSKDTTYNDNTSIILN